MKLTTVIALFLSTSRAANKDSNDGVWQQGATVTSATVEDYLDALTTATTLTPEACLAKCNAQSVTAVGKNVVCQEKHTDAATLTECKGFVMTDEELFATSVPNTAQQIQNIIWLINGKEQVIDALTLPFDKSAKTTQDEANAAAQGGNGGNADPCAGQPAVDGSFKTAACRLAASALLKKGAKSYVGYTQPVSWGSSILKEDLPVAPLGMSVTQNAWTDSAKYGCIIGYAVFALAYLYAIVALALDMRKRDAMYGEMIVEDLATMQNMGMGSMMGQIEQDLQKRLAGATGEEGVDDQLVTQALELTHEQYSKYM